MEEYRDRRIVTDGKLYGVEGELITDCRYLDPAGARAAIDSELGIARRNKDREWQREKTAEYFAREGQDWTFVCDCGWRGAYVELKKTGRPFYFACPACSSNYVMAAMSSNADEALACTKNNRQPNKRKNNKTST